ncbi:MAG: proton extrusion protein PcxA [Xenococcaceae cyanobacterium MO_188.B19]|nr:proton extrusion protein PcxA [Xenococcaceae cyanobacterium MO_188.B19]
MTSNSSGGRKSPLNQLKNQFFGNPEKSLKEAYEAASKIRSIENHYFSGYRIPVETLRDERLEVEVGEYLARLQHGIESFNASSSASGKLGSNALEKLIFAEGVLANYSVAAGQSSSLMPMPQQGGGQPTGIVDVPSVADASRGITDKAPIRRQPKGRDNNSNPASILSSGVLQGSLGKTFNKIKKDLNSSSEQEIVDEYRRSRQVTVIALRLIALLIIIPILTQQVSKNFLIKPIVEQSRGETSLAMTLDNINSEWKEEALEELAGFEEKLKMEHMIRGVPPISEEAMEEKVQEKANEIAEEFNRKDINSVSNVFADFAGLFAFSLVLLVRRKDINVLKSFIDNIIYGLSDSAKAFVIILFTDMFVGFHSPHGWEVLLESLANHLGVAANGSAISLFIATVPVVMDTMMKYWIFRYLSQMSASTVATLKEMNE